MVQPPQRPYFFLSYARGDDDPFVHQFYRDLSAEVRSYAGMDATQEVGFLDVHSIEFGATWSDKLMAALAHSHSFIALCSPRYFLSEACGREWAVFAGRMRIYERQTGIAPPVLLPLRWMLSRRIPPVLAERQYDHDNLPEAYRQTGLRQLLRLARNRDHYLEFVNELAQRVVDAAEFHDLPPMASPPEFAHVQSAFDSRHGGEAGQNIRPAPAGIGGQPDFVHFVIAAPGRAELQAQELISASRKQDFYGDTPHEWKPYHPALSNPIAMYAQMIAASRRLDSGVSDVTGIIELLEHARRYNQIVVLILDAWVTRLASYRQVLAQCERSNRPAEEPTTGILVPASHGDQQTQANWLQLADSVRSIFFNRANANDVLFRSGVLTHHAFDADLQVVLEVARNRVYAHSNAPRRPPGDSGEFPRLANP